jgi:hypothetical protein
METVTRAIDAGKPFDVYLDFAKAFDKVPRERLLEKLRAHGVQGRALNWIRSWLTGRKQRLVLNGKRVFLFPLYKNSMFEIYTYFS